VTIVDAGYELECEHGDLFDHVSDVAEADNLKRLHEESRAVIVDRWSVEE
jgi:hypothetical protein